MKRKYKLKGWVKVVIAFALVVFSYMIALDHLRELARECDEAKGYICTWYEVQEFVRGGR